MAKLIGTAGHVDHGKTSLIRALTGIDADRLPEEKQRGMTIDIGFAYIDLPNVGRVSIVDVPGHERFLTNMLVGALGIDVALLCVAADDSVMPQTVEHLQILDLLPVQKMVVALTRSDLAEPETREIAAEEVKELLSHTRFKDSPIIAVSAITGIGIDELREELGSILTAKEPIQDAKLPWYLPIDRVFSVKGHGCVVTGTLAQGVVRLGDKAFLEPGHTEVRVRGIQSHEKFTEQSERGTRTAINISGVKTEDIHRGVSIGAQGALFDTTIFDGRVVWANRVKHGARVRISIGADEVIGRAFLNDEDEALLQVRLERPIACALNQPFIVRKYSPPDVVGGGRISVPLARVRKRTSSPTQVIQASSDEEAILEVLKQSSEGVTTEEICRTLGKTAQDLGKAFESLGKSDGARGFAGLWFTSAQHDACIERLMASLNEFHEANPNVSNVPREKILSRAGLKWTGKPADRILAQLVADGRLIVNGTSIRHPKFTVRLSEKQRILLNRILDELAKFGINTPSPLELSKAIYVPKQAVEEMLRLGIEVGEIVRVGDDLYYSWAELDRIKTEVRNRSKTAPFGAGDFRDWFGTSRRFAIPLLEYFDATRFTLRVGDQRVLK